MSIQIVLMSTVLVTILIAISLAIYKVVIRNIKNRMIPACCKGIQVSRCSPEAEWDEKRQDPRINSVWPASILTPNGIIKAKIKDLSLGGAFIACQDPLPLNEQFSLIINLPDQKPLTLVSEVIWSNRNVSEEKIVCRGMGVRFTRNTKENRISFNNAIVSYFENNPENPAKSSRYHYDMPLRSQPVVLSDKTLPN